MGVAIAACVAIAGWRVAQWAPRDRGLTRADSYPASVVAPPPGSYTLRLPPGDWRPRTLAPGTAAVRELPVRLVFPPDAPGTDSSRYEGLYLAPAGEPAGATHRVVLLAEAPEAGEWGARAAALVRPGQWCLVVALRSPEPPDDSLTLVLTAAARAAE